MRNPALKLLWPVPLSLDYYPVYTICHTHIHIYIISIQTPNIVLWRHQVNPKTNTSSCGGIPEPHLFMGSEKSEGPLEENMVLCRDQGDMVAPVAI